MVRRAIGDPAAVLEQLRQALPGRRANLARLIELIRNGLRDRQNLRDAGLALDEIAKGRLYRAYGHHTFEALLEAELGITRMSAYKLRTIANAMTAEEIAHLGTERAYETVRSPKKTPRKRPVDRESAAIARALQARLRGNGVRGASVATFARDGKKMLRIEVATEDGEKVG